jgi:hypothetical protein
VNPAEKRRIEVNGLSIAFHEIGGAIATWLQGLRATRQ